MRQATAYVLWWPLMGRVSAPTQQGGQHFAVPVLRVQYVLAYCDPFALKSLLGHTTLAMTNHCVAAV
jgi:hypothetical protein